MDKVVVLMSTYNGEKYLKEQIESLKNQQQVELEILVRDDGSTDTTKDILEEYSKDGILTWYDGSNLRPARSFMELLFKAPEAEFYAFCDQDDFWMPDKLKIAVSKMKNISKETPVLYYGRPRLVDKNLVLQENLNNRKPAIYATNFASRLIVRNAIGCTFVMNKTLVKEVKKYVPEFIEMHDIWVYQICSAINGKFLYDEDVHILYRQHDNNVIGAMNNRKRRWSNRIKRFNEKNCYRSMTAIQIYKTFKDRLSKDAIKDVELIANYKGNIWNKFKIIFSKRYNTNSLKMNLNFRIAILFEIF